MAENTLYERVNELAREFVDARRALSKQEELLAEYDRQIKDANKVIIYNEEGVIAYRRALEEAKAQREETIKDIKRYRQKGDDAKGELMEILNEYKESWFRVTGKGYIRYTMIYNFPIPPNIGILQYIPDRVIFSHLNSLPVENGIECVRASEWEEDNSCDPPCFTRILYFDDFREARASHSQRQSVPVVDVLNELASAESGKFGA